MDERDDINNSCNVNILKWISVTLHFAVLIV